MKSVLFFTFINFFYLVIGTDTSTCNKLWETTNTINNIPLYSMKIYACVETPNYISSINPPIVHDHIKNHTNDLFKNIPPLNVSNSSFLNSTNNTDLIYLSNASNTKLIKNTTNATINKITDFISPSSSYLNKAPSPSSVSSYTSPSPNIDIYQPITPSPITPSSTTPSSATTPSSVSSYTTPSPYNFDSPSPSSESDTTNIPIDKNDINKPNENFRKNESTSASNVNIIKQDTSLIYVTIILSVIVGLVSLFGIYRLVKYCIEKKKCHDLLKKTKPETNSETNEGNNDNNTNTAKHSDKNEIISHTLDNMEKAKLRDIERRKTMDVYKKKTEYAKGARWKKSVKKVKKVNAINRSLTQQHIPSNPHVRKSVRENLIKQSKSMPNGENNPTIKKLIKRLDDADKEEKKQEDVEIPGTPPPPIVDNNTLPTRPIRKPPLYPPGMGHD